MWKYYAEFLHKSDFSSLGLKDILGFEPPKGLSVFLPYINCVPIRTLLPLYDTITVGIPKIENTNRFQDNTGFTFDEIVALAHREKLILFINVDCFECLRGMSSIILQLIDNDVPLFFAGPQETLLALKGAETAGIDVQQGKKIEHEYSKLIEKPETKKLREEMQALIKRLPSHGKLPADVMQNIRELSTIRDSTYPIGVCSKIKPTAEYLRDVIDVGRKGAPPDYLRALVERLHMIPSFLLSRALHSTLSTNTSCRYLYKIEREFEKPLPMPESSEYFDVTKLEFIERRLHIAYSEDIPMVEYADIFDSKKTEALRRILHAIMSEKPPRKTSFIGLQNSINEYNQEVNNLMSRKTKRAKTVYATSDIIRSNAEAIKMLMGGITEKFLNTPQKAWDCIVLPKRYRRGISDWLKQKAVWVESKLAGVSPEIIHLYHTRTCVEALKTKTPKGKGEARS